MGISFILGGGGGGVGISFIWGEGGDIFRHIYRRSEHADHKASSVVDSSPTHSI